MGKSGGKGAEGGASVRRVSLAASPTPTAPSPGKARFQV